MNGLEKSRKCKKIIGIDKARNQVLIDKPPEDEYGAQEPPKAFTFDAVYDDDSKQRDVYEETAYPLVESVMSGYNGTIFAYGQTGCGKTFTMEGKNHPPELQGIIPNTFRQIFDEIDSNSDEQKQFLVRAAYIEIYNEEVRDLLGADSKKSLRLKEDKDRGVFIDGLTENIVKDVETLQKLMENGNKNRTVGATRMNADSSRSHSIFMVNVETSEPDELTGEQKIKAGKLNLVDLAGSERQSKTMAEGTRLKEATKINLSLSALGNVISALVANKAGRHIPYRDSKLTRLLQSSLGGNTKTIMIAAISPAEYNYEETLSTLRYANRAKNIKNKPKVNEDPKDALLKEYQSEIARLKALLQANNLVDPGTPSTTGGDKGGKKAGRKMHVKKGVVQLVDGDEADEQQLNREIEEAAEAKRLLEQEREKSERRAKQLEDQIKAEQLMREKLASQLKTATEQSQALRRSESQDRLTASLEAEKMRAQELAARMEEEARIQAELQEELAVQQKQAEEEKMSLKEKLEELEKQLLAGHQHVETATEAQEKLKKAALKMKKEKRKKLRLKQEKARAEEEKVGSYRAVLGMHFDLFVPIPLCM